MGNHLVGTPILGCGVCYVGCAWGELLEPQPSSSSWMQLPAMSFAAPSRVCLVFKSRQG